MRLDYKGTLYIKAYGKYVPLSETVEHYENLEKENQQLKAQIEKMKCSKNCQTWNEWQCPYARDKEKNYVYPNKNNCPCDKWKIKVEE